MSNRSSSMRIPRLFTRSKGTERQSTWLEILFDLVFVITIAQLRQLAQTNLTLSGVAQVALLLVAVFWVWIGFSYYADQFDVNDVPYRVVLVVAMFSVIVFSLTIPNAFRGSAQAFALSYVLLRAMVIGLYARAWVYVREARPLVTRLLTSYVLSVALFLISIAAPEPTRYAIWVVALTIELLGSPLAYVTTPTVPAQVSHMPERFALFVIIAIGEAIVAVAQGASQLHWQPRDMLMAVSGFIVVVCMWRLYFNRADMDVISHAVHSGRRRELAVSFVFGYSHILITLAFIVGIASFIGTIEAGSASSPIPDTVNVVAGFTLALYLLGVTLNHWAAPHSLKARFMLPRLAGALLFLAVAALHPFSDPAALLTLSAAVMLVLVFTENPFVPEGEFTDPLQAADSPDG